MTRSRARPASAGALRETLDLAISEVAFQAQIVEAALLLGYLVFHVHDSRHSAAGYPDLTLCHPTKGRLIFLELKREAAYKLARHGASEDQETWLDALRQAGAEAHLCFPSGFKRLLEILATPPELEQEGYAL